MKLIHCADLHLDSALSTHLRREQAAERSTELLQSFLRLADYAARNEVRAVLIAGDLFDAQRVSSRTVDAVLSAVQSHPSVCFVYLAGNHDDPGRAFLGRTLPENLYLFTAQWQSLVIDDVVISGIVMTQQNADRLYESLPGAEGKLHIVTLHGQCASGAGVDRVQLSRLRRKGIAYLALGHIHTYALERLDEQGVYCYPGCLEGRGFDECGEKGFVELSIAHGRVMPRFVPFACRTLHRLQVDVSGLTSSAQLLRRLHSAGEGIPARDMVEFVLTGISEPGADVAVSYLERALQGRFYFSQVKDETRLTQDPAAYEGDISLKGTLIRLLLSSEESEEDKAAILRAGIAALSGEEILP